MGQYDEQLKKQAEKRKSGNADYGLYLKKNKDGTYSDNGRGKRKTSEDKAAYQSGEKKAPKSKLKSNVDDVLTNARFVIDDPTVSFGSLEFDKNAFNRAAEKQKKWWEDTGSTHKTYGYDMSDPEDVLRAQEGRYSKAYEASYGKDELSQWLMANGQASGSYFEQYYNEAAYDIMKERQKKRNVTALRDGIVNEINATAADPLNPTNEEVTQAALRVKASKAEYADIEIVNPKTSEASYDNYFDPAYAEQQAAEKDTVKREDALYLDDALDYYNKLWDNKKAKDEKAIQAEQSRVTDIIDSAIASSGYDSNINNSANGIAYSADSVNIDRNREAERNAYLSAVEGLKDKYTDEEIKILLANDGRLTYTQTAKDAEVSAEKQAVIDQRRDAIDMAGNRILGLDYVNENGQRVKKVSHSPEESIVLGVIDKARQFANMGTAAKEGFSPISMSEEWQAEHQLSDEERIVLDGVMATAHEQLAMEGFSDFEIYNYFIRADLGEYIPPEDVIRAALIESGLSQEAVNMVMDSYTDEDFANAQKIALDLAAIDGVDNSFGDQLGYSFASMAATAALKIGGGVVGFADMVSAGMQGREDTWELTKWFDEQADYWAAVGHDSNYKGLSTASEIGSEIIRMMSVAGMGSLAGGVVKGASAAKKGLSWFVKQAAQSIPFVSTAMGGYYNEAMANGATVKEATKYGVIAGTTEGILEKIAMGDVIQSHLGSKMFAKNVLNGTGVAKSTFARYGMQLVDILLGAVGEGLEESASYVASGLTRQATWDSSYKLSWGETGESFMGGLILGGLISGLNAPADSQRYKYAMKIMEQTGTFTTDMDSLYAASYFETLPEAQQKVYAEKYNSGEIVADNKTRKEAAKAERELDAINREVITKQQAFEAVKKDAQVKKEKADKKVADMKQRIATLQETNPIKKAKRIGELSQQLGSAQKAQAEVYSEAEKKVKTAENEYTSVLNKQTERTADLEETVLNYQAAKYFNDFYGKAAPTVNTADSGVQTAEPTENTTAPANTAENRIDTVKTDVTEKRERIEFLKGEIMRKSLEYEAMPEPAEDSEDTEAVLRYEELGVELDNLEDELEALTAEVEAAETAEAEPTSTPAEATTESETVTPEPALKDLGANTPTPVEMAQSKVYTNTYDKWLTDAEKLADDTGNSWYARSKEVDTVANAKEMVRAAVERDGSVDSFVAELTRHGSWDATDVDAAMMAAEIYRKEANESGDYTKLNNFKNEIRKRMTESGQTIQALAKWTRDSSAGASSMIDGVVDMLNEKHKRQIKNGKMNKITVPQELVNELLRTETREDRDAVMDKISQHIADQLPSTVSDKLTAWRYLAMLGNPRTHARNVLGNLFMGGLRQAKDIVGSGLEKVAGVEQSQRTKAILGRSAEDNALREYARSTMDDAKGFTDTDKYNSKTGTLKKINDMRTIFKSKVLEAARKFNNEALSYEDMEMFAKPAYVDAYAKAMKARGLTADTITAKQRKEIMDIAIDEALRVTFHDANRLSDKLSQIEDINGATKLLVGGVLPFKKTPMNILKRGIEYSPGGILQGLSQLRNDIRDGKTTSAEAIDKLSSGITGTSLMALGAFLAKAGLLTAGNDDEDKYYESDLGHQEYAVMFGDSSMTVDWITPASIPLFMGAELQNAFEDGPNANDVGGIIDAIWDTVASAANPLMELSLLQGLNDAIETASKNASKGEGGWLPTFLGNAAISYATQFVPTIGGQIARTIDPVRRDTGGDWTSPIGKNYDQILNKVVGKIPGLASSNSPYINVWGEEEINEHHWTVRLLENALLPGYVDKVDMTDVDVELTRLYSETQNPEVIPNNYPYRDLKRNNEVYILNNEEWTEMKRETGKAMYAAVDNVMRSPGYTLWTDEQKAAAIDKAIERAQDEVLDKYKDKYLGN